MPLKLVVVSGFAADTGGGPTITVIVLDAIWAELSVN